MSKRNSLEDNSPTECTQGGIMCLPGIRIYRGKKVYLLPTNKMVIHHTVKELSMPDNVIQHLNDKAKR